jgi:Kef-type K+ transport system membrane component KefB
VHGQAILFDIGLAIVAATAFAYIARFLGQPLLLGYIGAGLLIGPPVLGLIHDEAVIAELAELGLAFLMFIVGLEIDLKKLISSGRVGAFVGTVQVSLCAMIAFGAVVLLGFAGLPALYLGVASAFSSTMIVVKLLSDKSELDTVDGRLTLGILLMQDVLAIVVLAIQPNLQDPSILPIGLSLLKGAALLGGALLLARYVLPRLFQFAAKSPEIILISAVSWCLLIGWLAILANFSIAMGALIAGVTLSAFPYSLDVVAKIRGLRDFFVTLFFVALGMQLQVGSLSIVLSALALSAVVIVSRFITVGPTLYFLKYGSRVGTLCSIATAQTGEFALVIVALGVALGQIDSSITSILALTLVITSTISTYMIMGNHALARRAVALLKQLGVEERPDPTSGFDPHEGPRDVVLLGFHRTASSLIHESQGTAHGRDILVVDFSPGLRRLEIPVVYGDISHLDTLEHAGLEEAGIVLSTVSEDFLRGTDNVTLLRQIRRLNPHARVILTAETIERAHQMYAAGADYVILPRIETARAIVDVLDAIERGELDELRARALANLADRTEVLV